MMRRFLLIAVVWLLAVLVLAGGLAVYLLHDEPFLKRQIGELVADQTGRSLNIDGPLEISFGRVTTLEARGIRFANPDWAQSPELFRAGRLRIGIDLPSLFSNQPRLTEIVLEDCAVALERAADALRLPPGRGVELREAMTQFILDLQVAIVALFEAESYQARRAQLDPGDLLAVYTDGITEAINPAKEEYGDERLLRALGQSKHVALEDLISELVESVDRFACEEPQADDITCVAVRRTT